MKRLPKKPLAALKALTDPTTPKEQIQQFLEAAVQRASGYAQPDLLALLPESASLAHNLLEEGHRRRREMERALQQD